MSGGLSPSQILLLGTYALGMSAGQVLFKLAATQTLSAAEGGQGVLGLWHSIPFLVALALYAGLAVLWVWILSFTPLSRAYPFVALAFALTPILGGLIFAEPMPLRLLVGIALIIAGLVFVMG
jgi:multidrug transporter EmrE-like cation transporter